MISTCLRERAEGELGLPGPLSTGRSWHFAHASRTGSLLFYCKGTSSPRRGQKPKTTSPPRRAKLLSLSLAKSQPEKSEATSDNEGDPAHPHRYRPVPDDDGPLHENPRQVEQRHHGEDHSSHKRKRLCVHEPSSQFSNSG